jgi:cytoskeletal protein CcmA (bactofilin family)
MPLNTSKLMTDIFPRRMLSGFMKPPISIEKSIEKPLVARCVIGTGMRVHGECVFEGGLQVDGDIAGSVTSVGAQPSVLLVGETGCVEGAVSADHVVIAGTVLGVVVAREMLELRATARVQGDVSYKTLEMQPGAVVAGQLQPQVLQPQAIPAAVPVAGTIPVKELTLEQS